MTLTALKSLKITRKDYEKQYQKTAHAARRPHFLLAKQLKSLSEDFLKNSSMRKRMTKMRIENRNKK
jgi:four helix bundle suffix protein